MLLVSYIHPTIFSYFQQSSAKSGLKVADSTVQSAEYWCFYGTLMSMDEKKKWKFHGTKRITLSPAPHLLARPNSMHVETHAARNYMSFQIKMYLTQ